MARLVLQKQKTKTESLIFEMSVKTQSKQIRQKIANQVRSDNV